MLRIKLLVLVSSFFFSLTLFSQPCSEYDRIMKEASSFKKQGKYFDAIKKLNSAKEHCPKNTNLIDKELRELEVALKNRTDEDEKAKIALKNSENFKALYEFSNDRSWTYKNGKYALIDQSYKLLTDFDFTEAQKFMPSGFAIVQKNGFFYFIDINGILSDPYGAIIPTNNGWYKVKKGNQYTFVDSQTKQISTWGLYEKIEDFEDKERKINKILY